MRKLKEYSKRVLRLMIILWFIGAIFGCGVVTYELIINSYIVHLGELLTYIATPISCGVTGYLLKSAFENREKIKQNYNEDNMP